MSKVKEMFISIQDELINTKEEAFNGELSNLDALIKMREAKEKAEQVLEIVKDFENEKINEIEQEASKYPNNTYMGFEIKSIAGRKMFSYKAIEEIKNLEKNKKELEDKYKNAFNGFQKGIVQTTYVDEVIHWIDENGEVKPFPELSIGKSFLQIKNKNK